MSSIYDFITIGSGMGGSLITALNQQHSHILFEQDKNLGGCASTFKRFGYSFNAGATTLVGYEPNHILKKQFDSIGLMPDIVASKPAIRVIQKDIVINRDQDFEAFIKDLNNAYPNHNHRAFWQVLKQIDEEFWKMKHFYYAKYSLKAYYNSARSLIELLATFKHHLFQSATAFIKDKLPNISPEYQAFIDAQLLITVQSTSKEISLLSMALGLCYPFHKVYYAKNGMGNIIENILKNVNVHNKESIHCITKQNNIYKIVSSKAEYEAKNIILNSTIYDSKKLFTQKKFHNYYKGFSFSDQSAFTLYMTVQSVDDFLQHYQIILDEYIPNCISNAFFISFSKKDDEVLSKKNTYSITISTHTKAIFWDTLCNDDYEKVKQKTQDFILKKFLANFDTINKENIINCFSGTSKTFKRYINRKNCGGKAIGLHNILSTPTCNTPFKGLFHVGDTIFAGQGWPGVALGVDILNKELHGKL